MTAAQPGYQVGAVVTTAAVTVTEAHLVGWASLTGDWLPIHTNKEYAAKSRFGERVAHGPLTLALSLGLSTQTAVIDGDRTLAWLGMGELRALAPVLIGDTIAAQVTVADARSSKRAGQSIVTLAYRVVNQRDEDVMSFTSLLLVEDLPDGSEGAGQVE